MSLADLALEFLVGIGAALFAANAWVAVQEARRKRRGSGSKGSVPYREAGGASKGPPRSGRPDMARVRRNMIIGAILAAGGTVALAAHH
jgi:hypothetical protein